MLSADSPDPATIRLRECEGCGLFQRLPAMPSGGRATCARCGTIVARRRSDPHRHTLAIAVTALILLLIALAMPFIDLNVRGRERMTTLITGPEELGSVGMWYLATVVVITTLGAPLLKLMATVWVLVGITLEKPPRYLITLFRWVERISPWSMIEVFLLGVLVAYVKLVDLARVQLGVAAYALGCLILAMAMLDMLIDREAIWSALQRRGITAGTIQPVTEDLAREAMTEQGRSPLIGCDCCRLVSPAQKHCPRCGAALHHRKPNSVRRCWALLLAAALLYIPANALPVMTIVSLGRQSPETIASGVEQLAAAGMWPLAALVFFASITVPVLKLVSLSALMISGARHRTHGLRGRTRLYRVVDVIGRWSMIDVFTVSILTALVQMDALAKVTPGPGVVAFCAVVILTILAANSYDPRLMWDAASRRRPVQAPAGLAPAGPADVLA